jgi:hypothetical protein
MDIQASVRHDPEAAEAECAGAVAVTVAVTGRSK